MGSALAHLLVATLLNGGQTAGGFRVAGCRRLIWIIITAVWARGALHVLRISFAGPNPGDIFATCTATSRFGGLLAVSDSARGSPTGGPELGMLGARHGRPVSCRLGMGRPSAQLHGGRWRSPHYPVVRHVLRRPGRARLPVPSSRPWRLLRLRRAHPPRAPDRTLARRARPDGYPPGRAGSAWCCGASNGSWTSTSGSARTAISLAPGPVAGIALARGWRGPPGIVARPLAGVACAGARDHPTWRPPTREAGAARLGGRPGGPAGVGGVDD